jgi:hypothetical protein
MTLLKIYFRKAVKNNAYIGRLLASHRNQTLHKGGATVTFFTGQLG